MAARLRRRSVEDYLRTRRVGRPLLYRVRTTSTQDVARGQAEAGAREGLVVFAEEQTAGRGRLRGRSWASPPGVNIYCTILLRPAPERLARLSMVAPVAIANAVEQAVGLLPRIKWPNDLRLKGKKFGGVLIEVEWRAGAPEYALVGLGVNVNFDPRAYDVAFDQPATSLAMERGRVVRREPLLAAILNSFEPAYEGAASDALFHGWRVRLETLGRNVTVTLADGQAYEGIAEGVADDGALLLRLRSGELRTLHAGEVMSQAAVRTATAPPAR